MKFVPVCVASVVLLAAGSGCFSVLKRTASEVLGARSDATPVPGGPSTNFGRFRGVEILPPTTELGGLVSPAFKSRLVSFLQKELTQVPKGKDDEPDARPMFPGGSPTLTIQPIVNWFHKGGTVFPDKYAVVLYHLREGSTDLGKVQIVAESEASRSDDEALAEASAKGLAGYFKKHGKNPPRKRHADSDSP